MHNMRLIGIGHKMQQGKTTLGRLIEDELSLAGQKARVRHLADSLKNKASDCGWDGQKDDRGRAFLQEFGVFLRRINGNDYWIQQLLDYDHTILSDVLGIGRTIIVPDIRFRNEADWIKGSSGLLIKIYGRSNYSPLSEHESETSLDGYNQWDLEIDNSGSMEELRATARRIAWGLR